MVGYNLKSQYVKYLAIYILCRFDTYEKNKDTDDFVNLQKQLNNFYKKYSSKEYSGLKVKTLPRHNYGHEAWRPYI